MMREIAVIDETEAKEKRSALTMALWRVIQPEYRAHVAEIQGRVTEMLASNESFRITDLTSKTTAIPETEFRRYLHEADRKGELIFDETLGTETISRVH